MKEIKKLLSKGATNAKTAKNSLPTYILYLAPYKTAISSYNVCPKASVGCIQSCLFTAGRGVFDNVMTARINKTKFFIENSSGFLYQLATELQKISKKGIKTAIRLNGTSDIDFIKLIKDKCNIDVLDLPNLVFYDYTKILSKVERYKAANYTITFSRSETNWSDCEKALALGVNVSVLFDHRLKFPKEYKGIKVVDGDKSDIVMLNKKGVILGLKAKGKAKKDTTGFVVRF